MDIPNDTRGKKIRLTYRIGMQRKDREAVMVYLGTDGDSRYIFSARPVAGTQTLPMSAIIDWEVVADNAGVYLNRVKG